MVLIALFLVFKEVEHMDLICFEALHGEIAFINFLINVFDHILVVADFFIDFLAEPATGAEPNTDNVIVD